MWWPAVVKFPLRLDYSQSPHTYVNQRLRIQLELLMMSGMPLETCWAFNERWINKFYYKVASCWLFLLSHITMHGSMNIKFISNFSIITEGSRDGLTSSRCCNYSYMCSWWWVELPPETCRAVYRNIINCTWSHLVGQLLTSIHDARTHEHKKKNIKYFLRFTKWLKIFHYTGDDKH